MKVQAFLNILRPYAAIIDAHGGGQLAARMNALADVWSPAMSWNVKDLLSRAWPSDELPEVDEDRVHEFREAVARLQEVLKAVAKQDQIKDLAAIIDALEPHEKKGFESFIKACQLALEAAQAAKAKRPAGKKKPTVSEPVNDAHVAETIARLKQTYKDAEKFGPVFEALSAGQSLNQAELAAVASGFAYDTPTSTKKAESLRRIWLVHESYCTSAAKSKFLGGKSAA
jgi:hypothetical protein